MRRVLAWALLASPTLLIGARPAVAVEGTDIASAFDEGDEFDLYLGVRYSFEARRAAIKRELSGTPNPAENPIASPDAIPIVKDLIFSEDKHTITPHAELGVFHDVQLSFALPIVVSLKRSYELDRRADPCIDGSTCVDRTSSSTLGIDHLLPDGSGSNGQLGYDAGDPGTNFSRDSHTVFRSVGRSGLDQVHFGLTWAPMNQERDDTKPTWVLGAELRISVGKLMKWNRMSPGKEDGVSRGVHELRLATGVSKRTRWAEPFVFFWYLAPIGVRGDKPNDPDGSLFWKMGFGQRLHHPQHQAGTSFGFDAILFDKKAAEERLDLEFAGRVEAHFNGMGYSEMWEPFAYAGDVVNNPGGPLVIDPDPTSTTDTPISHPGVTVIENYMTFGARVGLNAQVGAHAKFGASVEIARDQTHAISFTDAGRDRPACLNGRTPPACDDDLIVNPGTSEVDPLHKDLIDIAGRRYIVDETTIVTVLLNGQILF